MKEKVTDRKENYAKIAILHDGENGRDYIELALDKQGLSSYSIIGEFNAITNGNILIYMHYDRKGKNNAAFTFTHDESHEILEGIRVDNEGNSQITYKLTYVKLSPK